MRCIVSAAPATACLLLLLSGCHHIPPKPLDFAVSRANLHSRPLDVEPVQAYAAVLAGASGPGTTRFDISDGLSLREGEAVALWYNPDLRMARLEVKKAKAVAVAAGRWHDPELGIESGRKSVESEATGFLQSAGDISRSWINAASLSITVPLSGRLRAERKLARTEYDLALLRATEAEWQTIADVRAAWVQWAAAKEHIRLLDGHLALLREFADTTKALAEAGEVAPSSARLFLVERLRREAERAREESTELERRIALLSLLGLLPDASIDLLPELFVEAPDSTGEPDLVLHPTLARLRAEYQLAEDKLRLEIKKQYPDLTLSPGYSDEQDETALKLGLGLPIPAWNANRAGIAEAAAERDIARAQAEAGMQHLSVEIAQAQAALQGSRIQRMRLIEGVVPVVDAQTNEALSLLKVGEVDIVLVYEALSQALASKEEVLHAAVAEAIAAARLSALFPSVALEPQTAPEPAQ